MTKEDMINLLNQHGIDILYDVIYDEFNKLYDRGYEDGLVDGFGVGNYAHHSVLDED